MLSVKTVHLAALAQLVEHLTRNEKVVSSILTGGSNEPRGYRNVPLAVPIPVPVPVPVPVLTLVRRRHATSRR